MELRFLPGDQITLFYGQSSAVERYYRNFGMNPKYEYLFREGALQVWGRTAKEKYEP